ncbi:hypothetical protein [Amycolatopsis japonica]|uniref:hypothetical protein n=1 Tax=Amycolatopsis japonica TaxID=208439 RepID=UPI0038271700
MIVNRLRPVGLCAGLLLLGLAVVAASFLLAWTAEAAQVDISGDGGARIPSTSPTPRRT